MRRWTVFAAALIILTLVFSPHGLLAKSVQQEKKTTSQTKSSGDSKSKKSAEDSSKAKKKADSSSKTKSKNSKTASTKKSGKSAESGHTSGKSKAAAVAAPVAVPVPDSYKGEFGVTTKAAMVMDIASGKVLFSQDADQTIAPASLTKILTLYLLNARLENGLLRPDDMIPVSQEASHAGGSNMRLKTGETVSLEDLIKGIAVASANDGCVAIAEYLGGGSVEPFVAEMNRKARELGMTNTHVFNPNGLPHDEQVTTARDMALLARAYLSRFPGMLNIHSMTEFAHNNRVRHNSNSLLGKVDGVDGLKTGFVCASGYNIVVTAKRGDTRLVAVVLGARNRGVRAREATRLVEEGFKIVAAEKAREGKHLAMVR